MIRRGEKIFRGALLAAACWSGLAPLAILAFLLYYGLSLLTDGRFFTIILGVWSPDRGLYGIAPMIVGSLAISLLGMMFAVPMCLGCALLIDGIAPRRVGQLLRRIAVAMTGMPTVVLGFVGIFLLVPLVRDIGGRGSGMCVLSAALLLALLVAPTMILFFVDSLERVPTPYTMAVRALGGSMVQALLQVRLPQARQGIIAGCLLGFGRVLGDTLIALMIAGNAPQVPASVLDSVRTLTAHIALVFAADTESPEFRAIFTCGLILYLLISLLTLGIRSTLLRKHQGRAG